MSTSSSPDRRRRVMSGAAATVVASERVEERQQTVVGFEAAGASPLMAPPSPRPLPSRQCGREGRVGLTAWIRGRAKRDDGSVDACLEQFHRCAVAQHMR